MAIPTTRQELKDYILRKLGSPVIEINIADEQLEDAIDDGLQFFQMYHYDANERFFGVHQITATDVTNGYIDLDNSVIDVMRVFGAGNGSGSYGVFANADPMFNFEYQLRTQTYDAVNTDVVSYYIVREYMALLNDIFNNDYRHRYERHISRLYVDAKWSTEPILSEGNYLGFEAVRVIDPETYPNVYGNWVLKDLCAAFAKKRWGDNLIKFAEIQLPGGVTLNGERILEEAKQEIAELKEQFILKYQRPDDFFVG